jgi:hypothetical protein
VRGINRQKHHELDWRNYQHQYVKREQPAQPIGLQEIEDDLNGCSITFVEPDKVGGYGKGYRKRIHNGCNTAETI